ncbi:MAG: hypothetical protein ACJA0H_002203, partial [Francisellaceae bacterium]
MAVKLFNSLFSREVTMLDSTKLQCAVYGDPYSGDKEAILCDDGELSSSIEIFGHGKPITPNELTDKVIYMSNKLNTFFKKKDQRFIATYYNDPDDHDYVIKAKQTYDINCDAVKLELKDIHQADLRKIQGLTRTDRFIITVETGKGSIEQTDYDRGENTKASKVNEILKTLGLKSKYSTRMTKPQNGQNPMHFNATLFHAHQDSVTSVEEMISATGSRCESLGAKDTLRFMHKIFDRSSGINWSPITTPQSEAEIEADIERQMKIEELLPLTERMGRASHFGRAGDGTETYKKDVDIADLLMPPLVTQIVGDDVEILDDGIMSLNGKFYKAMYIDVPQQKLETFASFIKTASHIPFVMSWHLDANEKEIKGALDRGSMLGMVGLFSQSCKDIQNATFLLKSYRKDDIKSMAMYRLAVLTWTDTQENCLRQANSLRELISRWGTSQIVRTEKANPVQSMLEILPSIAKPRINRAIPCLVEEALV